MSAQMNERQPVTVLVPLASITADASLPAMYCPRKIKLVSVKLVDQAGITANASNYVNVQLKNGSTKLAEYDSQAGNQGTLAANVFKDVPIVSGAETVAAGASLTVVYDETGTVGMTNALLQIEYYDIGKNS